MRWRFLALGASLSCALALPAAAENTGPFGALGQSWAEVSGFGGNDGFAAGEVDAFAALMRDQSSLLFMDFSGETFDRGSHAGNIALGYRQMLANGWNIGGYGGGDILSTSHGHTFYQISAGIELTSRFLDFRANGYLPDGGRHLIGSNTSSETSSTTTAGGAAPQLVLQGNQLTLQSGGGTVVTSTTTTTSALSELAYAGFDGEVGVHSSLNSLLGLATNAELRLYAGGFYFHNGAGQSASARLREAKTIAGPKARLELALDDILPNVPGSQLTLEAQYAYDDVRRDQEYVGLRLRIPFGVEAGSSAAASRDTGNQAERLYDRLRRDREILTQTRVVTAAVKTSSTKTTGQTTEAVADTATSVPINQVAFANATTGITGLAAANGANTLIIADGSKGPITGPQVLQASQTLAGGGATLQLQGVTTGTLASFMAPGTRPTLQEPAGAVLTIASSNHVIGLDLRGGSGNGGNQIVGNQAIVGPAGLQNVVIENNTLAALGDSAVVLGGSGNHIDIRGNTFSNILGDGVVLGDGNTNVNVSGNSFSNQSFGAVAGGNSNTAVTISQNTITNINFSATSFSGIGGVVDAPNAISFGDGNQVVVSNNMISGIGASVLQFGSTNNVQISGNTIANAGQNVFFSGAEDFPLPLGGGGPYAVVFADANTGTIANNTFTSPIGNAAIGSFSIAHVGSTQGTGNTLAGGGNVLNGSPKPVACGNFDAAHNPGSNIQFTDGSHCP